MHKCVYRRISTATNQNLSIEIYGLIFGNKNILKYNDKWTKALHMNIIFVVEQKKMKNNLGMGLHNPAKGSLI